MPPYALTVKLFFGLKERPRAPRLSPWVRRRLQRVEESAGANFRSL